MTGASSSLLPQPRHHSNKRGRRARPEATPGAAEPLPGRPGGHGAPGTRSLAGAHSAWTPRAPTFSEKRHTCLVNGSLVSLLCSRALREEPGPGRAGALRSLRPSSKLIDPRAVTCACRPGPHLAHTARRAGRVPGPGMLLVASCLYCFTVFNCSIGDNIHFAFLINVKRVHTSNRVVERMQIFTTRHVGNLSVCDFIPGRFGCLLSPARPP